MDKKINKPKLVEIIRASVHVCPIANLVLFCSLVVVILRIVYGLQENLDFWQTFSNVWSAPLILIPALSFYVDAHIEKIKSRAQSLSKNVENVVYALACDDEVNAHYDLKPSRWFRVKLAVIEFFK